MSNGTQVVVREKYVQGDIGKINNLLNVNLRDLVKSRSFPGVFQVANLGIVLFLIFTGWGMMDEALRYTNLASFIVWAVWWPGIIFAVLFAARAWCTVCHQKFIADVVGRFGLQLKVPKFITKFGSTVTVVSVFGVFILHATVVGYGINHFAYLSAIYLVILLVYTVLASLVFEKHSFCKSLCPLPGFLGLYSRCSPTELRSQDKQVCQSCRAKECVKNCPNKLYMGTMNARENEGCLLCFECVKHCPNDNVRFSIRPFFKGLWESTVRTTASTLAVIVLLGIIIGEIGEEWSVVDNIIIYVPEKLSEAGMPVEILGFPWVESIWLFIVMPLIIFGCVGILSRILVPSVKLMDHIKIYALGFVPLLLSVHLAKHWHTFNGKIGYLPHVLQDITGINTLNNMQNGIIATPEPFFMSLLTEGWFLIGLIAVGLLSSVYVMHKISEISFEERKQGFLSALPSISAVVLLGVTFMATVYNWLVVTNLG